MSEPVRSGRRLDVALGIVLGIVLGLAIVAAFVFLGSEGTVDAPRVTGVNTGKPVPKPKQKSAPAKRAQPAHPKPAVPTVHVIGGAPPEVAGPAQLRFRRGGQVRFRVDTDEPVAIEIPGYGIAETVENGSVVSFPARHAGQFAVIAAATRIGIAELLVQGG